MLLQWLSQMSIVSQAVISGGTAMKVVILDKVIVREKSARLISLFCFVKSVFIQAITEIVLSKFELLRINWKKR